MRFFSTIIIVSAMAGLFVFIPNIEENPELFTASLLQNSAENEGENENKEEAPPPEEPIAQKPVVLSREEILEDIQKKLDIISGQVEELAVKEPVEEPEEKPEEQEKEEETEPVYPKILISEVKVGSDLDEKQEFVELYNPSNIGVDLTGWYLQRKNANASSWSSYVSKTMFSGKIISGFGYLLIAREGFYSADIFTDSAITADNSFALKNPSGEISDKLGFGNAVDPEAVGALNPDNSQTIGRKADINGFEEDSDVNANDFELQNQTPGYKNKTYSAPASVAPPPTNTGGGGVVDKINYPQILISEVKIAEKTGDKDIFLELYNPNDAETDLTNWYIFRNDSSFITKTAMTGKIIPPKGYFLLTREGSIWDEKSDLLFDGTLNEDDNLSLKNPDGDVADEISWTTIQAGASWGRKWDDQTYAYFELDNLTPKEQNTAYIVLADFSSSSSSSSAVDDGLNDILEPPSITSYVISNSEISLENPSASIDLAFSEKVKYKIDIEFDGNKIKEWSGEATNPQPKIWDGKSSSGETVPNGIYEIKIIIENSAGSSFIDTNQTISVNFTENAVE